MPSHRGPAPEDHELFSPPLWPVLRDAAKDLVWLLDRGYAMPSALELVGNRYSLARRQRIAIARSVCSTNAAIRRRERLAPQQIVGKELWIDGFNVLITLESALGGGVILRGSDRCCRDIAGVYARYREVEETPAAIRLIGQETARLGITRCRWFLDRPVSNSGSFQARIASEAQAAGWDWDVELVLSPDRVLAGSDHAVASSDAIILDQCTLWVNLAQKIVAQHIPGAFVLDLTPTAEPL